eukprot:1602998-Pyramimonas_sp.AAC.1
MTASAPSARFMSAFARLITALAGLTSMLISMLRAAAREVLPPGAPRRCRAWTDGACEHPAAPLLARAGWGCWLE